VFFVVFSCFVGGGVAHIYAARFRILFLSGLDVLLMRCSFKNMLVKINIDCTHQK
jgi:hypothetical protein